MKFLAIVGLFFLLFSLVPQAVANAAPPADYFEAVTVSRVVVRVATRPTLPVLEAPKPVCGTFSTFQGPAENFAAWLSQTPCPGFELVQIATPRALAYSIVVTDSMSNQTVAVQRPAAGESYTVALHAVPGQGVHTVLMHAPELVFALRPSVSKTAAAVVHGYTGPQQLVFTRPGSMYNLRC